MRTALVKLGSRRCALSFGRSFGTKAHTFPKELPYYPYPKPGQDLDEDDWDSRPFENTQVPEIPQWGTKTDDWISGGPHPKTLDKNFYDIFEKKEKYQYTRTKPYALKKSYISGRIKAIFDESAWAVMLQHDFTHQQYLEFERNLHEKSQGRIRLKMYMKNSLARLVLQDGPYSELSSLFSGPTVLAYSVDQENLLTDVKTLISVSPSENVILLGAKIQDAVANYQQIRELKKVNSLDTLAFELIGTLQQPLRGLVQVLQSPQNNLIKTLDYQANQLAPENTEGAAGEKSE